MHCARCARGTESDPCAHCGRSPLVAGRYRLLERLGRGSSGTTWRAEDPGGRGVAIKAVPLAEVEDPKARELVEREVRVLRELSHPGIPAYVQHVVMGLEPAATLWLVQELVDGPSLAEEIETHRYSPREVLGIIDELAGILAYLHGLAPPVIHRDVKPGNVVRRPDGSPALIDFGSVRDVAKGSLGGSTVAGTFGYMAPEQFAGDAEPRSDLYGLGALAAALLTRREPQSLLDHANRLRWAEHTAVPGGLHDLVNRMVEPELERRAPSASWVQQRARTMLAADEREPLVQRPSERVDEVLAPKPRDLRWWAMAGALLLAVGALPLPFLLQDRAGLFSKPAPAAQPRLLEPQLPRPEPRQPERPQPRPGADAIVTLDPDSPLERIVAAIGEDPDVRACVARHQQRYPEESIILELHLSPPDEVDAVEVGPPSLEGAEVVDCLEQAAFRVPLRGVELERAGSVTLAFD